MARIEQVCRPDEEFAERLTALWTRVTAAGGAVGFSVADLDTDDALVASAAGAVLGAVAEGQERLFAATVDGRLCGVVFLVPATAPRVRHRGEIRRLMVAPTARGAGLGGALLDAAVAHAREAGLRTVCLGVRSGQGLEAFYAAHGWTERGRWPGAVQLGDDDYRDEVWFTLDLCT